MEFKVLNIIAVISMCFMEAVYVRAVCSKPSFGGGTVLSDEFILTDSFEDGKTVTFKCDTGYTVENPGASKSVTCNGGTWTNLQLKCKRLSCGSPPDFSHGSYDIPNGILFGDTITAQCDEGYVLFGSAQRTCRISNGILGWDGRDAHCEVVKCLPPTSIDNGQLEDEPMESYDYQDVVTYKCSVGFVLIGDSVLKCTKDGTFKPDPPKCVEVNCPKPQDPHLIRIGGKLPPYNLNNFLELKCDEGYKMEGANYITCTKTGWNPEPPRCIAIPTTQSPWTTTKSVVCSKPSFGGGTVLSDEFILTDSFEDGKTVTFKCDTGYTVENPGASKSVTCNGGTWTNLQLKCKILPTTPKTLRTTIKTNGGKDGTPQPPLEPGSNIGAIVGGILGAAALIGIAIGVGICFSKKGSNNKPS